MAVPVNTFNRKAEYGLAPSDIPHALTVSGLYELPIGNGKRFLNRKGVVNALIGGYQLGWVGYLPERNTDWRRSQQRAADLRRRQPAQPCSRRRPTTEQQTTSIRPRIW
ncbi:MAG: hypothetical protein WKF84_02565 [Pyrinomonadaceae bacterium]